MVVVVVRPPFIIDMLVFVMSVYRCCRAGYVSAYGSVHGKEADVTHTNHLGMSVSLSVCLYVHTDLCV